MNKHRNIAKIAGYSLVLMAVIAGFSFGFAYPKIYISGQPDLSLDNLKANLQIYQCMLTGIVVVILLDILIAWMLYVYFKKDHRKLSLWSFILRMVYTFIFAIATCYLADNLGRSNNDNTVVVQNFISFDKIWSIGLIVFGFHLILIGILMKLHKLIPKYLWYLTLIAGFSYVLIHGLKATMPQWIALSNTLENILGLPMALGELGLAIWLIIKGGKTAEFS